jgi:amino acid transporter
VPDSHAGLRRALTVRDLVVYGLLFIGPLAPVGVFGVLDAATDGAVALVYIAATVAMAFTAWSYAEMSRVVPHAGSVFAYAREGLGDAAGFVAGWLAMLDYLLIPSVAFLFSGIALHALMPAVPAWAFTIVSFAVATVINLAGVDVAARAGFVILVVEIAVFVVFVAGGCVVLAVSGPARPLLSPFTGLADFHLSLIVSAISIAVLSYLGFDAIAGFAEETTGDSRDVGRAIVFCLTVAGALFVLQSWLAAVLSPISPGDLAAQPDRQGTNFYDIVRLAIGPWLATTLSMTKAIGPTFAAMAGQAAAARLLYGMARDGRLPRALAEVDARRGVPRGALLSAAALTLVVSVWAAQRSDGLGLLVSIVDIGALAAFTVLHASVIGYFAVSRRAASAMHVIVPLAGSLVTVWVLIEASRLAQVVGGVWLAVGLVVYATSRGR